jgi:hypothetical protein
MKPKVRKHKTVLSLLRDPSRWTQCAFARNEKGNAVPFDSAEAVRFCLLGACKRVYGGWRGFEVLRRIEKAGNTSNVVTFNDNHSHAEVLALLKKAKI